MTAPHLEKKLYTPAELWIPPIKTKTTNHISSEDHNIWCCKSRN